MNLEIAPYLAKVAKEGQNWIQNESLKLLDFLPKIEQTNCFTYSFQDSKILNNKTWREVSNSLTQNVENNKKSKKFHLQIIRTFCFKFCGFSKKQGSSKISNKRSIRKNIFLYKPFKKRNHCKANKQCSICLSNIDDYSISRKTPCGHYFHSKCIAKWIKQKTSCPCCRLDLTKNKKVSIPFALDFPANKEKEYILIE